MVFDNPSGNVDGEDISPSSVTTDDLGIADDAVTVVPSDDLDTALNDAGVNATVLVRGGTYDLPDSYRNPEYQEVIGVGDVVIQARDTSTVFHFWELSAHSTLRNVVIDCANADTNGLRLDDHTTVERCEFKNSLTGRYVCELRTAVDATVKDCYLHDNVDRAIAISGDQTNSGNIARGCTIEGCYIIAVEDGIKLRGTEECIITGNTIVMANNNNNSNAVLFQRNDEPTKNTRVENNTIVSTVTNDTIKGVNVTSGNEAASGGDVIADNTFVGVGTAVVVSGPRVTVTDNTAVECSNIAFYPVAGSDIRMTNNETENHGYSVGIRVKANGAILSGNDVGGKIFVDGANNTRIEGGSCAQPTAIWNSGAVDIASASEVIVDSVTITESVDTGVSVDANSASTLIKGAKMEAITNAAISDNGTDTQTDGNYELSGGTWTAV